MSTDVVGTVHTTIVPASPAARRWWPEGENLTAFMERSFVPRERVAMCSI